MGKRLSPKDNELYQRVDEVLHYIWDPIGVSGNPMARDEYHSYLPQVFTLLREGKGRDEIINYLGMVEVERMGLSEHAKHNIEVAEVLLDWKEMIDEKST